MAALVTLDFTRERRDEGRKLIRLTAALGEPAAGAHKGAGERG